MRLYPVLKTIHVLAATLFFGAGMASAFYKLRADRRREINAIVAAQEGIVTADWIFTVPPAIVLPVTGVWMAAIAGYPLTEGWLLWGIGLFALTGACWLSAAILQIRMRALAIAARDAGTALPERYGRYGRAWFLLGIPAFVASVAAFYVMTAKEEALFLGFFRALE